jgi:hypothetical protein
MNSADGATTQRKLNCSYEHLPHKKNPINKDGI